MPSKDFTAKQKEIVARRMGYDGPMSMFDEFLKSDPAMAQKYGLVADKYMARGGLMQDSANNTTTITNMPQQDTSPPSLKDNPIQYGVPPMQFQAGGAVTTDPTTGQPVMPAPTTVTPQLLTEDAGQILSGTGGAGGATGVATKTVGQTATIDQPIKTGAATYKATQTQQDVARALETVKPATGTVSEQAKVSAAQGAVSGQALASAATFDDRFKQLVATDKSRNVEPSELVSAATQESAPTVTAAQAEKPAAVAAMTREITANEIVKPVAIEEKDMAQAQAITADGLAPDAKAVAAKLDKFSADAGTLAAFIEGDVPARATIQGQLSDLMKSFDDGKTPTWAAGAIRAANAAMAARGLGGSSIAGAAIFQAAMESALPIASQDAQTFATMNLQNLNNRQQVALANAAAQQNVSLANFNAEQQVALQNSANAFSLQSQNLSNMQQTMLANAQIRAAFQGQNLSNQQQAALANAARYAEINNINLNNLQQASLQTSANNLQVDLANLSNRQQAAVANAQLQAALELKNLDNKQQAAVVNASRYAEANNLTFTAQQNAMLHNSELMKTIGLANLNAQQAAVLQNAATYAAMDMANLNNRQQAAVENARAFLQVDLTNLNNRQQAEMFRAQSITQSIFNDAAASNAAKQFNATSQMQTDQFFASLQTQVSQFNASQKNAMAQFNTGQENAGAQFNAQLISNREQFNAQQKLVIDQSNAEWRRNIATANTVATNRANEVNAQNALAVTTTQYNAMWQGYRDSMQYAHLSGQNDLDRENRLAIAKIQENATIKAAEAARTGKAYEALGALSASILGKGTNAANLLDTAGSVLKSVGNVGSGVLDVVKSVIGGIGGASAVGAGSSGVGATEVVGENPDDFNNLIEKVNPHADILQGVNSISENAPQSDIFRSFNPTVDETLARYYPNLSFYSADA